MNRVGARLILAAVVSLLWRWTGSPVAEVLFWLLVLDAVRVSVTRCRTGAAPPSRMGHPGRASVAGFGVILESPGSHPPEVTRALRELLDMPLAEARRVTDRSAVRICSGASYADASQVAAGLASVGARVSVVLTTPEGDWSPAQK